MSLIAIALLVLTILLGTSAMHSTMVHFVPQLNTVVTLIWVAAYLAAFAGLMFSHGINWISWITRYRILLVILLLGCIISVAWSPIALVSAERVVHLFGCSILAIYIGFMVPLLTILRVLAVVLGGIMLASAAAALSLPDLGIETYEGIQVWKGVLNSKNALGFWAAVGVLLYITLFPSTDTAFFKLICMLLAGVCLGVLYFSHSATSLLALLIAGAVCLYIYIAIRFKLGFIRMAIMAILFVGLVAMVASNIDTAELVGRTDDLTGRGEVWKQTWKLIMNKPLTGYGYGALWFPTDSTIWVQQSLTDFTWVVFHAHNGLLQVASEIGLPLACIALLMVAQQLIEIFYCQYEKQQVGVLFVLGFVVAFLVSNFSEARFLVNRELYWIFFLALPISMLRQINIVSHHEELGEGGIDGTTHSVPGKPWLDRRDAPAGPAMTSERRVQAPLALDSADIDLGGGLDDNLANDSEATATSALSSYDSELFGGTLDTMDDHGVVLDYELGETGNYQNFTDEYDGVGEDNLDRYEKHFASDGQDIHDVTEEHDDTLEQR
ncbi:MAG: O-antigen ligase family protein [Granulosicoccaceae bacterium]